MLEKVPRSMYVPLIDVKPSDPSTIMTAATELSQAHTLITCEEQLYKVFVDIKWGCLKSLRAKSHASEECIC